MPQPITSKAKSTEYVPVKIYDNQNGVEKTYKFPVGTIFKTTNTEYHIEKNRIREFHLFEDNEGETLYAYRGDRTDGIPVILPQYVALDVLDVNNDQKIDNYDIDNAETFKQTDDGGVEIESSIADFEINERLERAKSNFRAADEWGSGVYIDKEDSSIHVSFMDIREDNRYSMPNAKSLSIFLPQE